MGYIIKTGLICWDGISLISLCVAMAKTAVLNMNVLCLDNNHVWHFQAQKLLLRDGTLANFTIQSPSTLPTITLGLPANARVCTDLQEISS